MMNIKENLSLIESQKDLKKEDITQESIVKRLNM
jgi:hypothetical protein